MKLTMTAIEWERLIERVGTHEGVQPEGNRHLLVIYLGRGTNKASYRLANRYLDKCLKLDGQGRYNPDTNITLAIDPQDTSVIFSLIHKERQAT